MKTTIIIGIVIVGIIGAFAVFASIPSDTWQDNRTEFTGVPSPDENKEKIDCLSRGGLWDNGCSIERRNLEDATSSYRNKIIPTLDDFRNTLNESKDIETIFFKFGEPHQDIGSGIHIYVYELNDSTEIWIGYSDHILYVRHVDSGGNFLESLFVENEN